MKSYKELDILQNLVKDVAYDDSEEIMMVSEYKYNDADLLIEEIQYIEGGQIGEQINYKYDDHGLCETTILYSDGAKTVTTVTRENDIITTTSINEEGQKEKEITQKLDADGDVLEEIIYNDHNDVVEENIFIYNEKKQLIEVAEYKCLYEYEYGYDPEKSFVKKKFHYNEDGKVEEVSFYNQEDTHTDTVKYSYNQDGLPISELHNDQHLISTAYDDKDRIIKETTSNRDGTAIHSFVEYVFDENDKLEKIVSFYIGDYQGDMYRSGGDYTVEKYDYDDYI